MPCAHGRLPLRKQSPETEEARYGAAYRLPEGQARALNRRFHGRCVVLLGVDRALGQRYLLVERRQPGPRFVQRVQVSARVDPEQQITLLDGLIVVYGKLDDAAADFRYHIDGVGIRIRIVGTWRMVQSRQYKAEQCQSNEHNEQGGEPRFDNYAAGVTHMPCTPLAGEYDQPDGHGEQGGQRRVAHGERCQPLPRSPLAEYDMHHDSEHDTSDNAEKPVGKVGTQHVDRGCRRASREHWADSRAKALDSRA